MGIQATITSQFVTVDLLWFTCMSLLEVLLVAHITKRWPTFHDIQPTLARYLQFMAVSLALLLFGTLVLGWNYADAHGGRWSFSLYELAKLGFEPHSMVGTLVFFAMFYALGIRIPLFPLHGWLSSFMLHGNVAVAPIYLLGLKVGIYGLLRFVFPIVPHAVWEWHDCHPLCRHRGVLRGISGDAPANLARVAAFAVISHTGILNIGFSACTTWLFREPLALNFGLAITGLLLMTGMVWQRVRTTRLSKLGACWITSPSSAWRSWWRVWRSGMPGTRL